MTEEPVELEEESVENVAVEFEEERVEAAAVSAEVVVLYRDAVAETMSVESVVLSAERVLFWCATGVGRIGMGMSGVTTTSGVDEDGAGGTIGKGMSGETTTSVVEEEEADSMEVGATQLGE